MVLISPVVPLPTEVRTTTTFIFKNRLFMETTIVPTPLTFENLWSLLYGNGATNYSKYDCNILWESLTTNQRHELYSNIKQRLMQKKYVPYNGLQAMQEVLRRIEQEQRTKPEPTDWNGARLDPPEPTEIACWNGHWGMYTQSDIRLFNLQTKNKQQ